MKEREKIHRECETLFTAWVNVFPNIFSIIPFTINNSLDNAISFIQFIAYESFTQMFQIQAVNKISLKYSINIEY